MLTSPDKITIYLGSNSYSADQIELAIKSATGIIEDFCNRKFETSQYTDWYKINESGILFLRQYPVNITSIDWYPDRFSETTHPIEKYDIDNEAGILTVPHSCGWAKVVFTAGYSEIPAGLEQLAIEITSAILQNASKNPLLASEKLGDYEYNRAVSLADILVPYTPRLSTYRKGII